MYIGLAMSMLVFAVMNIAQALPYLDKPFNVSKEAFDAIFGSAKLMYIASVRWVEGFVSCERARHCGTIFGCLPFVEH